MTGISETLREKLNFRNILESNFDPIAFARLKRESHNRTIGTEKGYDCPECLNRGNIAVILEKGNLTFRECKCKNIRTSLQSINASGQAEGQTFEQFQARESWQKQLLEGCRRFANEPRGWLLLAGQCGCGKSHLATAACRELILNGYSAQRMSWRDHIRQLKQPGDDEAREQLLTTLKTIRLLFIDDLFKTAAGSDGQSRPTAADVNLAFEILNYRYHNRLTTVITTEKSLQELIAIDEATGSRILEMARGHCYEIGKDTQKNYRLSNH